MTLRGALRHLQQWRIIESDGFIEGSIAVDLFSPKHLLVILLIVLVVFGAKKLRTIGSDLGQAVRGFKDSMKEGENEAEQQPPVQARQIPAQPAPVAPAEKAPTTEKTSV